MEETGIYKVRTDTIDSTKPDHNQTGLSQDDITNDELGRMNNTTTNSNITTTITTTNSTTTTQPQPQVTKIQSADNSLVIANQPRASGKKKADSSFQSPFNDANSERDWGTKLCLQHTERRSTLMQCCCWPAYRYSLAVRLGETPFMPLIPCSVFALRIKIRTLFGIKGSLIKDFFAAMCCEPCAICQMTREMDQIGL